MADNLGGVIGGVDTHGDTHHAAVIDSVGRVLGSREFGVTERGYVQLYAWMARFGHVDRVGIEGTGTYGAGLCRFLVDQGVEVVEVERPSRRHRRQHGKSDPIDAEAAARAVLSRSSTASPKRRAGTVESIRVLRASRQGAVKARTAAVNHLKALVVTAPTELRSSLDGLSTAPLLRRCAAFRPDTRDLTDLRATKLAMRLVARRVTALDDEIATVDAALEPLIQRAAPAMLELIGIGTDHAGQLLVTAGNNPDRLRSEASFAHLCGTAPIPASSGRTTRHRLHRGGDRQANRALHLAVVVRMRFCPRTRAYVERRTTEGLSKPEIMRCLKRYLAREVFHALTVDMKSLQRLDDL